MQDTIMALDEMVPPDSILNILCDKEVEQQAEILAEFLDLSSNDVDPRIQRRRLEQTASSSTDDEKCAQRGNTVNRSSDDDDDDDDDDDSSSSGGRREKNSVATTSRYHNAKINGRTFSGNKHDPAVTTLESLPKLQNLQLVFIEGSHTCRKDLESLPLETFDSILVLATGFEEDEKNDVETTGVCDTHHYYCSSAFIGNYWPTTVFVDGAALLFDRLSSHVLTLQILSH